MAKKKAAKPKSKVQVVKWMGTWPTNCDICKCDLNEEASRLDAEGNEIGFFVDGVTKEFGKRALMCPTCFAAHGTGLGTGKGQKYSVPSLVKIAG